MNKTPYIIWDWNGTLIDDVSAAVNALNRMLSIRGVAPVTRDFYRAHFGFPVRPFYAVVGLDLEKEDCIHRSGARRSEILYADVVHLDVLQLPEVAATGHGQGEDRGREKHDDLFPVRHSGTKIRKFLYSQKRIR